MYGKHGYDFSWEQGDLSCRIDPSEGHFIYTRTGNDGTVKKHIFSTEGAVVVNPVEPLNLPKKVSNSLEIEFIPLLVAPKEKRVVYLNFPVEIGIFVFARKDYEVLDIVSLAPQKYSLYGPPTGGVITRWSESPVTESMPDCDPFREGIIRLEIENMTEEWCEVARAIFDGYGMKIFYADSVIMQAKMRLLSPLQAETSFSSQLPESGMSKSIELYMARKIPAVKPAFLMEWGIL